MSTAAAPATEPVHGALHRTLSVASERTLHHLDDLEAAFAHYRAQITVVETALDSETELAEGALTQHKNNLALLIGELEKMQFTDVDAVSTAELHSGKEMARAHRKELTNKTIGLIDEARAVFHRLVQRLTAVQGEQQSGQAQEGSNTSAADKNAAESAAAAAAAAATTASTSASNSASQSSSSFSQSGRAHARASATKRSRPQQAHFPSKMPTVQEIPVEGIKIPVTSPPKASTEASAQGHAENVAQSEVERVQRRRRHHHHRHNQDQQHGEAEHHVPHLRRPKHATRPQIVQALRAVKQMQLEGQLDEEQAGFLKDRVVAVDADLMRELANSAGEPEGALARFLHTHDML